MKIEKEQMNCPFDKKKCTNEKAINVINFKKGIVTEINICKDCVSNCFEQESFNIIQTLENIELDFILSNQDKKSKLNLEEKKEFLKKAMRSALAMEDYELADKVRKAMEKISVI